MTCLSCQGQLTQPCAQTAHHVFQFWVGDPGTGLKTQELRQGNILRDLPVDPEGVIQPGLEGPSLQRSPNPSLYSCGHWCSGSLFTGGLGDRLQCPASWSLATPTAQPSWMFKHKECSIFLRRTHFKNVFPSKSRKQTKKCFRAGNELAKCLLK